MLADFDEYSGNDKENCIQKVKANILLTEKYFDGRNLEIDEEWVRSVC